MFHELSFVFVDVQMSSFTVANLHFERTKSTLPLTNTLQAGALTAEEQKAPAMDPGCGPAPASVSSPTNFQLTLSSSDANAVTQEK